MKNIIVSLFLLMSFNANAVTEVAASDLDKIVKESKEKVVVVDLYTDWCSYCKQLAPMLEKSEKKFAGKIKFLKINVDNSKEWKGKVKALPTILFLRRVKDVVKFSIQEGGSDSQEQLDQTLQEVLDRK